jgi:hypothetical protein
MKAVAQVQGNRRRKRKAPAAGSSNPSAKKPRSKDPLYSGGSSNSSGAAAPAATGGAEDKSYRQYGQGQSGRKEWKQRHKKGEFNPQVQKKNAIKTAGTFQKKQQHKKR